MTTVTVVMKLDQTETVRLDPDRLRTLYHQLGEVAADDVVGRAVEELAVRLAHCEKLWRAERHEDLRKCVRSIAAISDQIGMTTLARVAGDVNRTAGRDDFPALGATLCRLIRTGERSLMAVWDLHDPPL